MAETTLWTALKLNISNFTAKMKEASDSVQKFVSDSAKQSKEMSMGFAIAGAAVSAAFGMAIKSAANYDATLTRTSSLVNKTGKDFEATKKQIMDLSKEMSKGTTASLNEITKSLGTLAVEGFNPVGKSAKELNGILTLATSTGMDVGRATDMTIDIMKRFKMTLNDTNKIADILTGTLGASAEQMSKFDTISRIVAPSAEAAKVSFEDLAIIIGQLDARAVTARQSSSVLKDIFQEMVNPAGDLAKRFSEVNLRSKNIYEVFQMLDSAGINTSNSLNRIFKGSGAVVSKFFELDSSGKKVYQTMQEASKGIDGLTGSAQRFSDIQMGTYEAQMKMFKKSVDELSTAFGMALLPMFSDFMKILNKTFDITSKFITENKWLVEIIMEVGAAIVGVIASTAAYYKGMKILKEAISILATPMGAWALAIGGVTILLIELYKYSETFRSFCDGIIEKVKEVCKVINEWRDAENKLAEARKQSVDIYEKVQNKIDKLTSTIKANFENLSQEQQTKLIDMQREMKSENERINTLIKLGYNVDELTKQQKLNTLANLDSIDVLYKEVSANKNFDSSLGDTLKLTQTQILTLKEKEEQQKKDKEATEAADNVVKKFNTDIDVLTKTFKVNGTAIGTYLSELFGLVDAYKKAGGSAEEASKKISEFLNTTNRTELKKVNQVGNLDVKNRQDEIDNLKKQKSIDTLKKKAEAEGEYSSYTAEVEKKELELKSDISRQGLEKEMSDMETLKAASASDYETKVQELTGFLNTKTQAYNQMTDEEKVRNKSELDDYQKTFEIKKTGLTQQFKAQQEFYDKDSKLIEEKYTLVAEKEGLTSKQITNNIEEAKKYSKTSIDAETTIRNAILATIALQEKAIKNINILLEKTAKLIEANKEAAKETGDGGKTPPSTGNSKETKKDTSPSSDGGMIISPPPGTITTKDASYAPGTEVPTGANNNDANWSGVNNNDMNIESLYNPNPINTSPDFSSGENASYAPGYALGTTNVPEDMTAKIHKGEIIIPPNQSKVLRKNKNSLPQSIAELIGLTYNGSGTTIMKNINKNSGQSSSMSFWRGTMAGGKGISQGDSTTELFKNTKVPEFQNLQSSMSESPSYSGSPEASEFISGIQQDIANGNNNGMIGTSIPRTQKKYNPVDRFGGGMQSNINPSDIPQLNRNSPITIINKIDTGFISEAMNDREVSGTIVNVIGRDAVKKGTTSRVFGRAIQSQKGGLR